MLQNLVKSLGSFWFYGWVFDMEASFRMMLTFLSKSLAHGSGLFIFKLLHIENWNTRYSAGKIWHFQIKFPTQPVKFKLVTHPPPRKSFCVKFPWVATMGGGDYKCMDWSHITFVVAAVSFERVFRIWTVRSFLFQLYPSLCPYRVSI